jgi:DNA-binding transcriptional ArsR family regulator
MKERTKLMPSRKDFANEERLHKALGHSTRIQLLAELLEHGPTSPARFVRKHNLDGDALGRISYHFRVLQDHGLVFLHETIPKRGAQEHIYKISPDAQALPRLPDLTSGDSAQAGNCSPVLHLTVDELGIGEVDIAFTDFQTRLEQAEIASKERSASTGDLKHLSVQIIYSNDGNSPHADGCSA